MMALALYSVFVCISLTVLWSVWKLTKLGKYTYFAFNRHVLTGIIVFSLIIASVPFLVEYQSGQVPFAGQNYNLVTNTDFFAGHYEVSGLSTALSSSQIYSYVIKTLLMTYFIGLVVSFILLAYSLTGIVVTIFKGERIDNGPAALRLVNDDNQQSFAWGGRIIISRRDWMQHGALVLTHERVHLAKHHWIELLLVNIVKSITWYCPTCYLILRDLIAQQEYEADAVVKNSGYSLTEYMMLLIEKANGRRFANFVANGINNPYYSLKNRISMMKQMKSENRGRLRILYVLPFAALMVLVSFIPGVATFAHAVSTHEDEVVVAKKPVTAIKMIFTGEKQTEPIDSRITIPSLSNKNAMELSGKIIYPADMQKDKLQGSVAVKITVEEDGTITAADVLASSGQKQLDDAVLSVINGVKITPGKYESIPSEMDCILRVTFKSQSSSEEIKVERTFPDWEMDELVIIGA